MFFKSKALKALNYLLHDRAHFVDSLVSNLGFLFPDKLYLSLRFRCQMGYWINWKKPKTFSEKLQWLKIYDRKPEYTTLVDKYAVKDYVARRIGNEYIIPTLGVWGKVEDIEWDKLPKKFVLKTTHGGGSGGVVICRDKKTFDKSAAVRKLRDSFKSDIYSNLREWPYKNVPRRIIAEELLEDDTPGSSKDLSDYKFFCFGGRPRYCQVISGRNGKMAVDFYDMEWVHQSFHEPKIYPFAAQIHSRPVNFETMKHLAAILSQNHAFLRVDFYEVSGKVFLGELTFFPTSGLGGFSPQEWDCEFGNQIKLPRGTTL